MTNRTAATAIVLSLVAIAAAGAGQASLPPAQEIVVSYLADPAAAREEFRASGSVSLTVPVHPLGSPTGVLAIDGVDITAQSIDTNIYDIPADPTQPAFVESVADVLLLVGRVRGADTSTANLYLGQVGVYGTVTIDVGGERLEYAFDSNSADEVAGLPFMQRVEVTAVPLSLLDPVPAEEGLVETVMRAIYTQPLPETPPVNEEAVWTTLNGSGVSPPTLPEAPDMGPYSEPAMPETGPLFGVSDPPEAVKTARDLLEHETTYSAPWICPSTFPTALIYYISTQGFVESNPGSWFDRIVSANSGDKPAWNSVCINLTGRFGKTHDIVSGDPTHTSDSCNLVNDQFKEWLYRNRQRIWFSGTNVARYQDQAGYQLWTSADLKKDGIGEKCFGTSSPDSIPWKGMGWVERRDKALGATSVVEGRDVNCCDLYNPGEAKQRAVVSGHELGHVFGQEGPNGYHPTGYCNGEYNMMEDSWQRRAHTSPCFLQSTKYEVNYRFHANAEY